MDHRSYNTFQCIYQAAKKQVLHIRAVCQTFKDVLETQSYRVTISHLIQLTSASSKRQTSSSVLTKGPPTIMIELQDSESKSHVSPGVTIMISASLVRFTEQSTPPNPLLHVHTPGKQITIHILSIVEAHEMVFVFFFHHPWNCWDLFCCHLSVGIPFDLVRKNLKNTN